ncbi:MAG: RING-HC finger protein, partial [Chloroflexi bacterium]|nr:RING-HC finger protein [Chloroflexota bacterium]
MMTSRETRPFPAPAPVVMRSALFALATSGAKLQAYNEETGVIVATLSKRLGLQKGEVVARVRPFQENAVLELQAPTDKTLQDMLHLIATYVQDGAKVEANARIQWIDLQKQADSQQSRQRLTGRVRSMLPGRSSSATTPSIQEETSEGSETDAERDDPVGSEAGELMALEDAGERTIPIPDNPGVLVKNHQDKVIELKLDPATFVDRTNHLEICDACAATVMRGSLYCPNCGRPLTLSAVQPELRDGVESAVTGSVRYGLIGLAFN